MLAARGPNGEQVANPAKFPNGFKAVADFIHSLGLKAGLYTAKGQQPNTRMPWAPAPAPAPLPLHALLQYNVPPYLPHHLFPTQVPTPALALLPPATTRSRTLRSGQAGALTVSFNLPAAPTLCPSAPSPHFPSPPRTRPPPATSPADVKDDSCSVCQGFTDDQIYGRMWQAMQDSGRPMVLTVEGKPTDSIISLGGYGNAKRVGHDISPQWTSMTSLVDAGSGLWMYAHNSTNATFGGWCAWRCSPHAPPSPTFLTRTLSLISSFSRPQ